MPLRLVRHVPLDAPFDERIQAMMDTYAEGLRPLLRDFDVVHVQDCLSANAALTLRDDGVIDHVLRTVHHVDDFTSPSLIACQDRSIVEPDRVLCVSQPWVDRLADEFGIEAGLVRNGVDTRRYRPPRDATERAEARSTGDRFTVLTVGGIEPRKGSLTLLEGFAVLRDLVPERDPLLLIAGGMTLFDYRHERERFDALAEELEHRAARARARPAAGRGDGAAVPRRRRLRLPVGQGGLRAGGARGAGRRAAGRRLRPRRLPRTSWSTRSERTAHARGDGAALGRALARLALDPELADRLRAGGREVVPAHTWDAAAAAHERAYEAFLGARVG